MAWADDLERLARERGPALVGYAYLLTGDVEAARDLVQEALARTFGRPRSLRDDAALEAYVRRAALNVYLDGYRRDRLWGRALHLIAAPETAAAEDARTADHLDVQQALAALTPRERACVVLRFYDDLTVPALADRLGISEGAAKRYLSDAVRRLGMMLGHVPDHEDLDITIEGSRR